MNQDKRQYKQATVALLALLTLAVAAPAHASPARQVSLAGCAQVGYTIEVPTGGGWTRIGDCTKGMTLHSPDGRFTMTVDVERHSYWNDARSRSSITNDARALARAARDTMPAPPKWWAVHIDGHPAVLGVSAMPIYGVENVVTEAETFYAGYMFKVLTAFVSTTQGATLGGSMLATMRLFPRA